MIQARSHTRHHNCLTIPIRTASTILAGWIWFYLLVITGLTVLWLLLPQLGAQLGLLNIFAAYLFAPLLLVLPLALWLRSRAMLVATAALALAWGVLFVPGMLPDRADVPVDTAVTLRVITFNQLYNNNDPGGTLAVLDAQQADIIVLQELSRGVAEAFQQRQTRYPYQVLNPHHLPGGLGIVSRYPIENVVPLAGIRGVRATLTVDGQAITLINVHPNPPAVLRNVRLPLTQRIVPVPAYNSDARNDQLTHLLNVLSTIDGPMIVAGDFNTSDRELIYDRFDAVLHDAYAEAGWGMGHTFLNTNRGVDRSLLHLLPRVRIDYVWSSTDFVPLDAAVNCEITTSDHCMVVADLGWMGARR